MLPVHELSGEMLAWKDLKSLCASPSPCITITLPAFHQGAQTLPYATQMKHALRTVQQELFKQTFLDEAERLIEPLHKLIAAPEMHQSGRDMVIFRSPAVLLRFDLPAPVKFRSVVGRYFHVAPFLHQLSADREFYILELNQKHLRLLHCLDGACADVPLPSSLPESVEQDGAFDAPDHMLRNRSSAGTSNGSMSGVSFGTGSEREKSSERLHHFFKSVDDGLAVFLKGRPLLLSGARHEVAIYRRAATYAGLLESELEKDLHSLALDDVARLAQESLQHQSRREAHHHLQQLRELAGSARISTGVRPVLKAASEGRVAELILAQEAEFAATREALESDSPEDLLNAAAVLTIRNGGEVFTLPAEAMGAEAPVAAILRY
jgi:hypothetical protein